MNFSNERNAEATNVRKFSELAADYGRGTDRPDLDALAALAGDLSGKMLLDTAAGRGACALRMAACGAEIHLADLTHAMLAEGRSDLLGRGLEFRAAVARNGRLPFPTGAFDVVTCTRAYHHLADIGAALLEARRVLKPSGRLLVTDHSGPDTPEAMAFLNKISRLRDGSHAETLSPKAWRKQLVDVGFDLQEIQTVATRQELDVVLESAGDVAPKIEALFENAPPSVLHAIEFTGSAPADFASVIVVFDAVSVG